MQTLEKRNKQLIIYAEINAIMKQSNNLLDIVNANQKTVNNLKAESDKLEKEINIEKEYNKEILGKEVSVWFYINNLWLLTSQLKTERW